MVKFRTVVGFALGCGLLIAGGCDNAGRAFDHSVGAGGSSAGAAVDAGPTELESGSALPATETTAGSASPKRARIRAAAMCPNAGPSEDGSCRELLSGVYGVKLELDVWWLDEQNHVSPMFDPGRGVITLLAQTQLSEFCQVADSASSVTQACDLRLPVVYSDTNGGAVQLAFSDATWDQPSIPSFASEAHISGFAASDSVSTDPIIATFGIALTDTELPWPSYKDTPRLACAQGTGASCFPDHDGDGQPGITAQVKLSGAVPEPSYPRRSGWRYTPVPTDPSVEFYGLGATRLYLGLRTTLGASHPIGPDCQGGVSPAEASDVELRVLDCTMRDGTKCNPAGATFVDQNVPAFHVLQRGETPPPRWKHPRADADAQLDRSASLGPTNTTIRLGSLDAETSCAEIRELFSDAAF